MTQQVKNDLFSVRLDARLKADASAVLATYGLNLSDAVRMLLTRITIEKRLPQGLVAGEEEYDKWFWAKVHEALDSTNLKHSHETVMTNVEAVINKVASKRASDA